MTMIKNIESYTGKNIDELIASVRYSGITNFSGLVKYIQKEFNLNFGYANYIAKKANLPDSVITDYQDDLLSNQYKNKENLLPLYYALLDEILRMGNDIIVEPKRSYVSLKRKKQFAIIHPTGKSHIDIGFNMKKVPPLGMLELSNALNPNCTHIIKIEDRSDINDEVLNWLKKSYDKAG